MDRDEELPISVRYSGAPFTRGPLDFLYPVTVYSHETPLPTRSRRSGEFIKQSNRNVIDVVWACQKTSQAHHVECHTNVYGPKERLSSEAASVAIVCCPAFHREGDDRIK